MVRSARRTPNLVLERKYWSAGHLVAGVDETGRGSIAGPLIAAAVILDPGTRLAGFWRKVNDSKKLSRRARTRLAGSIRQQARAYAWGIVPAREIDKLGIDRANQLAYERAIWNLPEAVTVILADWLQAWPLHLEDRESPSEQIRIARGDALHLSVAAASILAKVYKDHCMAELDRKFPQFGFSTNSGYLTPAHAEALDQCGPCTEHRFMFRPLAGRYRRPDGRV